MKVVSIGNETKAALKENGLVTIQQLNLDGEKETIVLSLEELNELVKKLNEGA